jgi:hypothetical protein
MNKFQDYIGSLAFPGVVIDRRYGETCEKQRYCIVTTRGVWYSVFLVIEVDESESKYKIVTITKQFTQSGIQKDIEKVEKIKKDQKKLIEIYDMDDYQFS